LAKKLLINVDDIDYRETLVNINNISGAALPLVKFSGLAKMFGEI